MSERRNDMMFGKSFSLAISLCDKCHTYILAYYATVVAHRRERVDCHDQKMMLCAGTAGSKSDSGPLPYPRNREVSTVPLLSCKQK